MAKFLPARLSRILTDRGSGADARVRADAELDHLRRRVTRLNKRLQALERSLEERVAEVEEGLQEQRALSHRVAALTDLVAETIAAAASGDRAELEAALDKYTREV